MSYMINESKLKLNLTKQKLISSLLFNNYELVSICFARVFTSCYTTKSWLYSGLEGGLTLVIDYRTKCGRLILFDLTTFEMTFEAEMYKKFDTFYTKLTQNIHCFEVQKGFIGLDIPDATEADEFFAAVKGLTESAIAKRVKEFKPIAANDLTINAKKMLALLKARLNDEYYFKDSITAEPSIEFNAGELETILDLIEFDENENTFLVHGKSSDVEELLKKVSDIKCMEKGGLKICDKRAYALQMANNLINTSIAEKNQIEFLNRKAEEKKAKEIQKMNAQAVPSVPQVTGVPKVPSVPSVPSVPAKGVPSVPTPPKVPNIPAGKGGVPKIPGAPPKIPPVPTGAPKVKPQPTPQVKATPSAGAASTNTVENPLYAELQAKKNKLKQVEIKEPQVIGAGKVVGAETDSLPTSQPSSISSNDTKDNMSGQSNIPKADNDNKESSETSEKKARAAPKLDMMGELKMRMANREKASYNYDTVGQKSKTEEKKIDFRANLKHAQGAIAVTQQKNADVKVSGKEVPVQAKPKTEELASEKKENENEREAVSEMIEQEKEGVHKAKDTENVGVLAPKEHDIEGTDLLDKQESIPVVKTENKVQQKNIPVNPKKPQNDNNMSKMIEALGQRMGGKPVVSSADRAESSQENSSVTITSNNSKSTPVTIKASVEETSNQGPIVTIAPSSNTAKMDISKLISGMEKTMSGQPTTDKTTIVKSTPTPTTTAKPKSGAIPQPPKGIPPIPSRPPPIPKQNTAAKPVVTPAPVTITTSTVKETSIQEEITKGVKLKETVTQEKFGLNYKKEMESQSGKNNPPQETETKPTETEVVKGNLFSELKKVQLKKINK